jgi:hypothetical protein
VGGSGSGNHYHWWRGSKQTPVEDCKTLDLMELARKGCFVAGYVGSLRWLRGDQETGSIGYRVRAVGPGLQLVLAYRVTPPGKDIEEPIPLETTRLHRGGLRWWGRCPLVKGGVACLRRVGKLYLPPGGRYFGCRRCYDLTYTSCQESRRYDGLYRHIAQNLGWDPADVKRTMDRLGKRRG